MNNRRSKAGKTGRRSDDFYDCPTFSHGNGCCGHYISTENVRELELQAIRSVGRYAIGNEIEFAEKVREVSALRHVDEIRGKLQEAEKARKRIDELDAIIRTLYERYALGKIPESRFEALAAGYEKEQSDLRSLLAEAEAELVSYQNDTDNIDRFMKAIRKYAAMVPMMDWDKKENDFQKFMGTVMIADIGNGTMNIMRLENGRPLDQYCWTEVLGVHQCALTIRKQMMDKDGLDLPEDVIEQFLRTGKTHLRKEILESMNAIARGYVSGLFDALRAHGYDPRMMKLYVLGGGGCLVKRFGKYDPESVVFVDSLNAAAKGYEYMAQGLLWAKENSKK